MRSLFSITRVSRTPLVSNLAVGAAIAAILMIASATVPVSLIPVASAACPDAEVVFARGRFEPPGVGAIGDAFVNALRSKTARSVGVYGVNYVADLDAANGARDIGSHIRSMARDCPNTRMVVGGYSIGATAADLFARANSLPPDINRHVAAIVLFGNGTRRLGPAPAYAGRTIDQCADGDPICGRGLNWDSHLQPSYLGSGLVDQAASIVAGKL
ncbi:cutinase family protein [Mycobacterium barrassiae]|uniref:cutinase family protein n=1 Tax=Mycobacterium barrassiae TaxID=319709 RepID=UPI002265D398|nr:cutinase family protein [Mycobacterium barrassiae]MCV7300540.1 cutinase family protein [Mycobacterium barrassiae]